MAVSISLCQYHNVLTTIAFYVLISGSKSSPAIFFSFKITWEIPGPLHSHLNFRTNLTIFNLKKHLLGFLHEITLTVWINLERTDFLGILIFLNHRYGLSLNLFMSPLFLSITFYSYWCQDFSHSSLDLFLFHIYAITNDKVLKTSFFYFLLLYGNIMNLCISTFYPVIWLNSLMSFIILSIESLDFLCTQSCRMQIMAILLHLFQSFISFACLIALIRTSSTMLNGNGDSGHLVLYPVSLCGSFTISQ